MNATERLVEAYFRSKGHFTITDIKVPNGNNRQFDLLTFDIKSKLFSHVEINVTHMLRFHNSLDEIAQKIDAKFFGVSQNKRPDNTKTDFAKGKTYEQPIRAAYQQFGIDFQKVTRVWCTWCLREDERLRLPIWKKELADKYHLLPENFAILEFRDEVLKYLINNISTANYDDELLRAFSLIAAYQHQLPKKEDHNDS